MRALIFAVSFIALTASVSVQAQEKVLFRYNPPVGETIKYTTDMNMDVEGEASVVMDMKMVLAQTAQAKSDKNTFALASKIESVKMDMNAGMMMLSYDSENPDESNPMTQEFAKQLQPLLEANLMVETNERAEVLEINGAEGLQGMVDLKQLFNSAHFPEQPIQVGDSWEMDVTHEQLGLALKYVLTYAGLENGLHRIDIATDPNAPATQGIEVSASGFNLYVPQSFVLEKSEITSKVDAGGTSITTQAVLQKL